MSAGIIFSHRIDAFLHVFLNFTATQLKKEHYNEIGTQLRPRRVLFLPEFFLQHTGTKRTLCLPLIFMFCLNIKASG